MGILKAIHSTVIPASLHTLHECGLVFDEGLSADTYHMDVTGEFLNRGIECKIKMREFKMYPSSPEIALELMVDFDSRALHQVQYKEGDVIGVVQFRSTSLDVDQSNPVNKDFENMIDNEDRELFGAFPEWFAVENDCRSQSGNDTLLSMQLNDEQLKGVDKLLGKFETLFSAGTRGFKQTHLTEYIIETVGNPIEKKPYPLPMVKMNWVHNEVEHLLKAGIIHHSVSLWCSPVIVVDKKQIPGQLKEFRLVVDYRALNLVTKLQRYQLPLISQILTSLKMSSCISMLDLTMAYHHIPIRESDKVKTAFQVPGLPKFEYNYVSFGLVNAPYAFQQLITAILFNLKIQKEVKKEGSMLLCIWMISSHSVTHMRNT